MSRSRQARRRSRMWQEGIPPAPAVTGRVLPGATAYLTWGVTGECDDATGTAHAGCVRGAGQGDGVLAVPGRDPTSRFTPPHGSPLRAQPASSCTRCQTFPAPGPLKRAVGWPFPRVAAMPVSSRAPAASVLVVPHASHRLWVPAPMRNGRGSDAAVQARLDRGPHGVPRGCQLSSQSSNGGSP